MIRRIAEAVLADVRVLRHAPQAVGGGALFASAGVGGLRYLFRRSDALDPTLCKVAEYLVGRGDVVWDVGANVGLFSVAAAHLCGAAGAVFAFEADADAVSLLRKTQRLQRPSDAPMTVVPIAVADRIGFVEFQIARRARSANALAGFGSTQTGGYSEVRRIPAFDIDDLLGFFTPPNVVKIDVEGAEALVLRGAQLLLRSVRPAIFCEVTESAADEVTRHLHHHDYVLFGGTHYPWRSDEALVRATWDTVAIPRERLARYGAGSTP
ncbi:FkbM family methyltransferase [Tahibacter amnicola]|uniref:FkbM family methyltransferase n=1 Tax=Tahibacter amnicola TaxID=2976241 RepID=A0ABY6B9M7_9GAMM|nr:FkbM family methyltransferase [Tahibacter amnicola]UXI66384.1 FkbM family methyltransferase [Tahibacter amnicola]